MNIFESKQVKELQFKISCCKEEIAANKNSLISLQEDLNSSKEEIQHLKNEIFNVNKSYDELSNSYVNSFRSIGVLTTGLLKHLMDNILNDEDIRNIYNSINCYDKDGYCELYVVKGFMNSDILTPIAANIEGFETMDCYAQIKYLELRKFAQCDCEILGKVFVLSHKTDYKTLPDYISYRRNIMLNVIYELSNRYTVKVLPVILEYLEKKKTLSEGIR